MTMGSVLKEGELARRERSRGFVLRREPGEERAQRVARSFGIPIQGEEPRSRSLPAEPCVWLTGFILVLGQFIDLTREL